MRLLVRQAACVLLALMALVAGAAAASDRRTTLDEAVADIVKRDNGRVISAETERREGRETHRIRVLTRDGRVKRYRVDAESGRKRGR